MSACGMLSNAMPYGLVMTGEHVVPAQCGMAPGAWVPEPSIYQLDVCWLCMQVTSNTTSNPLPHYSQQQAFEFLMAHGLAVRAVGEWCRMHGWALYCMLVCIMIHSANFSET